MQKLCTKLYVHPFMKGHGLYMNKTSISQYLSPPLSHLKGSVVFVVLNHILKVASQHCIQVGHIICVGDVDVITETVS